MQETINSFKIGNKFSNIFNTGSKHEYTPFYNAFIALEQWRINSGYEYEEQFITNDYTGYDLIIKDNFWSNFDEAVSESLQDLFIKLGLAKEVKPDFTPFSLEIKTEEEMLSLYHYLNLNSTNLSNFIDVFYKTANYPVNKKNILTSIDDLFNKINPYIKAFYGDKD